MKKSKVFLLCNLMLFSMVFVSLRNHFFSHPWPVFHALIVTALLNPAMSLKTSSEDFLTTLSLLSLNIYSNRYHLIVNRYDLL